MELIASVTIVGIIAALCLVRTTGSVTTANANSCHAHQGEIELQAQLWYRNNGSFPASNLGDIGTSTDYFPEGVPTCPVDGSTYTIDTATGRVIGHAH